MKMNKKNAAITSVIAVCLIGAIGGGVWYSQNNETAQKRAEIEQQIQEATTANVEVPTENPSAGVYEIKTTPSNEAVDDALYAKIAKLNTAAKTYFDKNDKSLLCAYGLMYSDDSDFTVSASQVAESEGIEVDSDIDDYADILLVRPSDLAQFESIELKNDSDTSLKPFTAYNSSKGYIISSYEDKGGILSLDQYRSLLGSYASDHGSIVTASNDDETYWDIVAATDFKDTQYDAKYVAYDEKYAVAVIGGMTEKNNIKQYVLTKKPGGWAVIMDGLETSLTPRYDINRAYPDMDLGLLPVYTIAEYGNISTGFVEYEQSLIDLGLLKSDDMPETYSCGAGKFAYIEMTSGKKLLGVVNDSNQLEFYEVANTNEAISAMLKFQDTPPFFILHYNQ